MTFIYLWFAFPAAWDSSLGFPGEGPHPYHRTPAPWELPQWVGVEHQFIQYSRSVLTGASPGKGLLPQLVDGATDAEIESILRTLAERGNSARPVAARFQSRPKNVKRLLPQEAVVTASAAARGVAYRFSSRPYQYKTPRPFRLAAEETAAVSAEVLRLRDVCQAIERAPLHDQHRAILLSEAHPYELEDFPAGPWPDEAPVPILHAESERKQYDRKMLAACTQRLQSTRGNRQDFESAVFTVPKSDGGHRLCTDFRALNAFVQIPKFQMEGTQQVAELIQRNDFAMLVDLKDCYLTMGVHPGQRRYCRFRAPDGTRYQWKTVSFGMAEAPQICTKLLRPLIKILKGLGIRCLIYIDDLLILHQDRVQLAKSMAIAMELLQDQVGLQLKISKGQWAPSQVFTCLGLVWDTLRMQVAVPPKRIKAIQRSGARIQKMAAAGKPIPTRDVARLVGQIISTTRAIRPAKRRLLYLQHALGRAVKKTGWKGHVVLSKQALLALDWWQGTNPWKTNGNDIVDPIRPLQVTLRTDAATNNVGFGGEMIFNGQKFATQGYLTRTEQAELYINEYEFSGMQNTLQALLPVAIPDKTLWPTVHISVELDNLTSVKYGTVAVSRSIKMSEKGAAFFDWKELHGLAVSFRWLAGRLNVRADQLSRRLSNHVDWQLHPWLFRQVMKGFRMRADVDLFASCQNCQLPSFYAFHHDHRAVGADAFNFKWIVHQCPYAYPPPILISRILQKMIAERLPTMVLLVPVWMAQTWWPTLMSMMLDPPILLPNEDWITRDPMGNPTWPCRWPLAAFSLSGDLRRATEYRRKYWNDGGRISRTVITRHMTSLLKLSGCGLKLHTPMTNSVLQQFRVDCYATTSYT